MAYNPDDLLIFRMREMPPNRKITPRERVAQRPVVVEAPEESEEARGLRASLQTTEAVREETEPTKPTTKEEMAEITRIRQLEKLAGAPVQPVEGAAGKQKRRFSRGQKAAIAAAKGLACVNHPWRAAYAICDYCDRPFCYADLVEFNHNYYDLEDIDKVTSKKGISKKLPLNTFAKASSIFFILNAFVLAYFIYPQTLFITNYIYKVGINKFLYSLNYSYGISLVNTAMIILSLVAGVIILMQPENGFYLSGLIGAFILSIASYEYLSNTLLYLLVISVMALLSIGTLAYSRMSATTIGYTTENIKPTDVEWPRLESF